MLCYCRLQHTTTHSSAPGHLCLLTSVGVVLWHKNEGVLLLQCNVKVFNPALNVHYTSFILNLVSMFPSPPIVMWNCSVYCVCICTLHRHRHFMVLTLVHIFINWFFMKLCKTSNMVKHCQDILNCKLRSVLLTRRYEKFDTARDRRPDHPRIATVWNVALSSLPAPGCWPVDVAANNYDIVVTFAVRSICLDSVSGTPMRTVFTFLLFTRCFHLLRTIHTGTCRANRLACIRFSRANRFPRICFRLRSDIRYLQDRSICMGATGPIGTGFPPSVSSSSILTISSQGMDSSSRMFSSSPTATNSSPTTIPLLR